MALLLTIGGCVASFASFWQLHWSWSPRLNRALIPAVYSSRLTDFQRREWDSRVVSTVHALLVCLAWLICVAVKPSGLFDDPGGVGGSCFLTSALFVLMSGYMLSDSLSMLAYMGWREMALYQLHHWLSLVALAATTWHGVLHYFVLFRVAAEMSTPLVNSLWFFRASGYREKAPLAYTANSLALLVAFACCRILPIPLYWLRTCQFLASWGLVTFLRGFPIILPLWIAGSLLLDCLNLAWFRSLIIGSLRIMRSPHGSVIPAAASSAAAAATAAAAAKTPSVVKKDRLE